MNIVLSGPPGSGKGTQSNLLCEELDLIKISVGDILRNHIKKNSSEDHKINSGNLVGNKIVFELVKNFIDKNPSRNFLFDGFPRTLEQDKFFDIYNVKIKYFIQLYLDEKSILDRISYGRLIHEKSGRVYHEKYNPPKVKNIDDITQEKLVIRKDDNRNTIMNRIQLYKKETIKLISFYKLNKKSIKIIEVNSANSIQFVKSFILDQIDILNK